MKKSSPPLLLFVACFFASQPFSLCAAAEEPEAKHWIFFHHEFGAIATDGKTVFLKPPSLRDPFSTPSGDDVLWWVEQGKDSEGHAYRYLHPFNSNLHLTGKDDGTLVLTEKPEAGSSWKVSFPKDDDDRFSSFLTTFGERRLDMVKEKVDGKELEKHELKLGPKTKGDNYDKVYPKFLVRRGGFRPLPEKPVEKK